LLEVTLALGAEVMVLGGLAANIDAARAALTRSLASGAAAERFSRMVAGLGGPPDLLERPDTHLAKAPVIADVPAPRAGFVTAIDTRALGLAVVAQGGGRTAPDQAIDPAVGFDRLLPCGARAGRGDALARVHAATEEDAQQAVQAAIQAYSLGDAAPTPPPLIERIQ